MHGFKMWIKLIQALVWPLTVLNGQSIDFHTDDTFFILISYKIGPQRQRAEQEQKPAFRAAGIPPGKRYFTRQQGNAHPQPPLSQHSLAVWWGASCGRKP
eukprot:1138008-Pelagomonas_calceolata.AAC.4